MKNYIDDLNEKIESKKREEIALQSKIDSLISQKNETESQRQKALSDNDNEAYLTAYRKIKDLGDQIGELESLLKAKQASRINAEEVRVAWNKTLESFETDRKKKIKEYKKAKSYLAKLLIELCSEENKMRNMRSYAMSLGGLSEGSGRIDNVTEVEPARRLAFQFLAEERRSLGISDDDFYKNNF